MSKQPNPALYFPGRIRNKATPIFSLVFLGCSLLTSCTRTDPPLRGLSPEEALPTLQVADGFQVELVAAEPLVADPIAMEIDEYGRMYVVEMHGYPLDKSGSGKIRLLTDTDGDGRMDQSTVFAEDLVLPTGVMRWKKGILVTDPPNVLYLEDTDGDGKSDVRRKMLSGFALANPQHNVNHPLLGIDNWIYLGHEPAVTAKVYTKEFGDRGSEVHFTDRPDGPRLPENALGRSVRFQPDRFTLETLSSNTQFGHTFDRWGHRFLVSNANHGYYEVLAAQYLNRNPELLVAGATESISDHGNAADVYPITRNPQHQLLTDLGVFTSACGITSYGGGAFPAVFDSVLFVAEPVSNIVHADVVRDKGAAFTARRLYEKKEFLASTDAWFRPVNLYVGPDGALYVVDYYRQIIEHPEWMADDVVKSGALYNGMDQGRIYRITPKGTGKLTWSGKLRLGDAGTAELIKALSDTNGWWRRNAQRLLVDRKDKSAVPALEELATGGADPQGRLHALWTLEGLDAIRPEIVAGALRDKEAGIRENAIRIAELILRKSDFKGQEALEKALVGLQHDKSPKVAFQLLCTLGYLQSPEAIRARKQLLFANLNDSWMQLAALSAVPGAGENLLDEVLTRYRKDDAAYASLVERLSNMAGNSGKVARISPLIRKTLAGPAAGPAGWEPAVLRGLAQGYKNRGGNADSLLQERELLLSAFFLHPDPSFRRAALDLLSATGLPPGKQTEEAMTRSLKTVADRQQDAEKRAEAIRFIAVRNPSEHAAMLKELIDPVEPLSVQMAALQTLNAIPDSTVSIFLTGKWKELTPGIREAAIATYLRNDARVSLLLDAVERKVIEPGAISWPRQVGLMANGNEALRNRARKLLSGPSGDQQGVIKAYEQALTLTGNAGKGKEVYLKNCAVCHQIGGKNGVAYGPDLGTVRNRRPESIMADILNPNFSIADGYDIWNVELKSGETLQGLIASETPAALTLRNYGGIENTVARNDIAQLKAMGVSVMPTGLEKQLSKQDMADLLAYIRQAD